MGQDKILVCPDSAYVEDGVLYLDTDWDGIVPDIWENIFRLYSDESFTLKVYDETKHWDGTLYYTNEMFGEWEEWDGTTTLTSGSTNELFLKGEGNTVITGDSKGKYRWVITGTDVGCDGNIETLLDNDRVEQGRPARMGSYCFAYLFYNASALSYPPEMPTTKLTDGCYLRMFYGTGIAEAPILPATIMTNRCYSWMFAECSELASPPELPAMSLAEECYSNMFRGSSITYPPELPAKVMAKSCYLNMFYECFYLSYSPNLSHVEVAANSCFKDMFARSGITTCGELPHVGGTQAYASMFNGCYWLKSIPDITINSEAASVDFSGMFQSCDELDTKGVTITIDTTHDTSESEYRSINIDISGMFMFCYAITEMPTFVCNFKDTDSVSFDGGSAFAICTGLTSAIIPIASNPRVTSATLDNMFQGCTGLTEAPGLIMSGSYSYCQMHRLFSGCSNIVSAGSIEADTILCDYAYAGCSSLVYPPGIHSDNYITSAAGMFKGCTSLRNPPILKLSATRFWCASDTSYDHWLGEGAFQGMFEGCTALNGNTTTYEISVKDYYSGYSSSDRRIPQNSFKNMFKDCTSLERINFYWSIPGYPVDVEPYAFSRMFSGCSSLTRMPELPTNAIRKFVDNIRNVGHQCESMFLNCTSLTIVRPFVTGKSTIIAPYCFASMFNGCTSLQTIISLPFEKLETKCYESMYRGCTGIKISETSGGEYTTEFKIPTGDYSCVTATDSCLDMFKNTGGTFTGTPSENTTYYTSNQIVS